MDLQQTIEDLERQAAKYTEAANSLRALLQNEGSDQGDLLQQATGSARGGKRARGGASTRAGKKSGKGNKRSISEETRAKMAAAARARYQRQREGQGAQGGGA